LKVHKPRGIRQEKRSGCLRQEASNPKNQIPSNEPNPNFQMEDGSKPRDLEERE
jgi:hypothetical protein